MANSGKLEASPSDAVYVNSEEGLRQAVKKSGTIILEGEIPLTQTLVITGVVDVELVGGNVTFAGDEGGEYNRAINVRGNSLNLRGNTIIYNQR